MAFHSIDFLLFFAVAVTVYWRLPHRAQNVFLLAASYLFYGWVHPWFVLLMLASTHLVAGPIMRAHNLLTQVEAPRRFSFEAARQAVLLAAWGFFKKLVIADNVGVIANRVFAYQHPSFEVLWACSPSASRPRGLVGWLTPKAEAPALLGAEVMAVGVLVTLTLVLRSQVSLDFIYFQF